MEQAACALLLGEADHALRMLRLDDSAATPPDREVAEFAARYDVRTIEGRLLAACALCEQWVHAVVAPAVTWGARGEAGETAPRAFDLATWGETPQVRVAAVTAAVLDTPPPPLPRPSLQLPRLGRR